MFYKWKYIWKKTIYNIVKNCYLNNIKFNTQELKELGGSSNKNDIECNYINGKKIGIEIKKSNIPDWMQCCIIYNNKNNKWEITNKR